MVRRWEAAVAGAWSRAATWATAPGRAPWLLAAACLVGVLPYVWLARYIHPSADDYSFLVRGRALWENYADLYLTRFGRYTSNLLVLVDPFAQGGLLAYRAVAVVMIVGTGLAFYVLFRTLLRDAAPRSHAAALAAASLLVLLSQMPTLAEGIYWYTGAMVYQAPNLLFLLYAASLVAQLRSQGAARWALLALNALLLVVLGGFNEGMTMLLVAMHAFGAYKAWSVRSERVKDWLVLAVVSLAAFAIMALAPANGVRSSVYAGSHDLPRSLAFTALQTVRFSTSWISSAPFLVGVALLFLYLRRVAPRAPALQGAFHVSPLEGLLAVGVVFFACTFPAYWFTGAIGQHRTMDTAQFFFLLAAMLNVCIWALRSASWRLPERVPAGALLLAAALFVVPAATTHNGYDAAYDLIYGVAAGYDAEQDARYLRIEEALAANASEVTLEPLANRPRTIFVLDATHAPEHWINTAMRDHFGIGIVVERATP